MWYLTFHEVLLLHDSILGQSGGSGGLRDLGGLESAIAQPRMSVSGEDAYPTLSDKAAALCYSLANNHPFVDGNKRVAHAAMEAFLMLNGMEIEADVDDQERVMLNVAAGQLDREDLAIWLSGVIRPITVSN